MKKETIHKIIVFVLLLTCLFGEAIINKLFGQVYTGIGITNKGSNMSIGAMAGNVDLKLSYQLPFTSNQNKKIAALSVGYQILANEQISIIPSFGYAHSKWKDFSKYGNDLYNDNIETKTSFSPIIGVELNRIYRAGNVFVFSNYCSNDVIFGIGLKVFFSKL